MAKTDYTKMENLLNEALLKMTVSDLWDLAGKAETFTAPTTEASLPSLQARTIVLSMMHTDITTLMQVKGVKLEKMGITLNELTDIAHRIKDIDETEWVKLKKIRENIASYKQELWDKIPHLSDEELIELERKKHLNKRYNVRDKWLPLH